MQLSTDTYLITQRQHVYSGKSIQHDTSKNLQSMPTLSESASKANDKGSLRQIIEDLRDIQEIHNFLCIWLLPCNALCKNADISKVRDKINERSDTEDELIAMSQKLHDLHWATEQLHVIQRDISQLQIETGRRYVRRARKSIANDSTFLTANHEPILLRAFHQNSFCIYNPSVGILSSNYAACKPVNGIGELKLRDEISEAILKNHCGGGNATSFISLTDDPCFLLNHINRVWPYRGPNTRSSGMVAFVNKAKLDYMRIFCDTSRSLVENIGAKRWHPTATDGVNYATHSHFMVYGWIPIQCIEKTISLAHFERTCSQIPGASANSILRIEPREILARVTSDDMENLVRDFQQAL